MAIDKYLFILPVILYEFLAISVTRAVIPALFLEAFGPFVYHVIGVVETVKGVLAFIACPLVGKVSDKVGRKACLLVTVIGTTFPVCILAFTLDMRVYAVTQALSGVFAGTFTLTFAYIADCVEPRARASAYGLALATLGLSFTVGPVSGGYLALRFGVRCVFFSSLILVIADVLYVVLVLPESLTPSVTLSPVKLLRGNYGDKASEVLPAAYNPLDALEIFAGDPLLSVVARVTFLYYTGVWAVVSTLMIYLVRRFDLDTIYLGYLLGCYGGATMISEGFLVRIIVPLIGEINTIRLGLIAFTAQCIVFGLATQASHIWLSIFFSLFSNLVYPALSSLVSASVPTEKQGEAQGAINGVRALTEGFGPLCFGVLMHFFEEGPFPGIPYLVAAGLILLALAVSFRIPDEEEYSIYLHQKENEFNKESKMERSWLLGKDDDEEEEDDDVEDDKILNQKTA